MTDEALTAALTDAARTVFTALPREHPDEDFYAFVLNAFSDLFSMVYPHCHSEQALRRVMAGEGDEDDAWLRWNVADWAYEPDTERVADAELGRVQQALHDRPDPYNDLDSDEEVEAEVAERFACSEAALARLDAEGFFGAGAARDRKVLAVLCPDGVHEEQWLAIRRLNPPGAVARFFPEGFPL